jgi:hypothetical protein
MSALDGRIRHLAREEAAALLHGASAAPERSALDRVAELEVAVTSLHGTVLRLEARLDALEKAAGEGAQEKTPTQRRTRKTAETSE